ncbi:MAG TPA: hypothetical protein VE085_10545 [Burkholderiales bacterium]|nr:hypothetical protein [Burkholderiales bacterium]
MPVSVEIGIALLAALVIGNLAVSVALIRCRFYTPLQKLVQAAIVWLIPILGAVGIWSFLRAQYNWEKYDTRAFPEPTQKGVAIEVNNAIHDSFGGGAEGGGDSH